MKILALEFEQPGATVEDFNRIARSEAAKAWELYQAGVIRGFTSVRIDLKPC